MKCRGRPAGKPGQGWEKKRKNSTRQGKLTGPFVSLFFFPAAPFPSHASRTFMNLLFTILKCYPRPFNPVSLSSLRASRPLKFLQRNRQTGNSDLNEPFAAVDSRAPFDTDIRPDLSTRPRKDEGKTRERFYGLIDRERSACSRNLPLTPACNSFYPPFQHAVVFLRELINSRNNENEEMCSGAKREYSEEK